VVPAPEPPVEAPLPAPRRAAKPDRSFALRITGGSDEAPSAMPRPNPHPEAPATVSEKPAPDPDVAEAPETPAVPVASTTSAEPQPAAQTPEEGKPKKTGNRFVRA